MRIAQTTDGRFIKVLSPELQGLIGRLYKEIQERREADSEHNELLEEHSSSIVLVQSKLDMLLVRYAELTGMLNDLFPADEDYAIIERPLLVTERVTALQFISEIVTEAPFEVASTIQVDNLNAHYLNGKTSDAFAPIEHVGASGDAAHPLVTHSASGFMSTTDKKKVDGMTVSKTAPSNPAVNHIWFDLN